MIFICTVQICHVRNLSSKTIFLPNTEVWGRCFKTNLDQNDLDNEIFHTFRQLFNIQIQFKHFEIFNFIWSLVKMLFSDCFILTCIGWNARVKKKLLFNSLHSHSNAIFILHTSFLHQNRGKIVLFQTMQLW